MKKTIHSALLLLLVSFSGYSQHSPPAESSAADVPPKVLIVDATLKIMLVNTENAELRIEGKKFFREYVTVQTCGDTLRIGAVKNLNLISSGVIYVPARFLRSIQVNSNADMKTLFALRIPKLDVLVNGACTLAISNFGEVNIIEAKGYAAEKTAWVKHYPAGIL